MMSKLSVIGILHEMECSLSYLHPTSDDVPSSLVANRHVETHFGPKRKVDIYLIYSDHISNEILVRTLMQGGEEELNKRGLYQSVKLNIVGIILVCLDINGTLVRSFSSKLTFRSFNRTIALL
jgi:hypothetical protein